MPIAPAMALTILILTFLHNLISHPTISYSVSFNWEISLTFMLPHIVNGHFVLIINYILPEIVDAQTLCDIYGIGIYYYCSRIGGSDNGEFSIWNFLDHFKIRV